MAVNSTTSALRVPLLVDVWLLSIAGVLAEPTESRHDAPDAAASMPACSTTGPATMQHRAARVGGVLLQRISSVADARSCAAKCCGVRLCRSWTFSSSTTSSKSGDCDLMEGYAVLKRNTSATSGVVYRTGFQGDPWQNIRGFNYVPPQAVNDIDMWRDYDRHVVERDMEIAETAGFNFARVFLNFHVWDSLRDNFIENLGHFMATAHAHGIDVMPIPFDLCWFGCTKETITVNASGKCWYASPQWSLADNRSWWREHGEKYVDALVGAFPAGTPGLLLWDVVNEPEMGGLSHLPGERGVRWDFVRHFVRYFKSKSSTPTTVGVADAGSLSHIAQDVDILTFHSYHRTWEMGLQTTELALSFARMHGKPIFNSETGCIARSNAFDQTIEMCRRNGIGFVVWELMISNCLDCVDTRRWKHGLMYTDGTTRDPAAIAALRGVYLNRGDSVELAVPRPDVEGRSTDTADRIVKWLAANSTADYYKGIALLDELSNLAEASGTVPLVLPPSAWARKLAAVGESLATRAELITVLAAEVGPLSATKMGSEAVPGTCTFGNTSSASLGSGEVRNAAAPANLVV